MPPASTQRRDTRFDFRLSAEFRTPRGALVTAMTKNVSVSGAALELGHASLEDGQEIQLSLFLVVEGIEDTSKPPLSVLARVMWSAEADDGSFAVGVRFERISPEQVRWLARFLEVTA